MEWLQHLFILLIGLVAGFINTVAAGGSILVLPVLILSGLPSDMANGTNRVAILFQNIVGVRGFKQHGHWAPKHSLLYGGLALIGAVPGAFLAIELSDVWFQRILGLVIVLIGGYLLFQDRLTGSSTGQVPHSWKNPRATAALFLLIGLYGGFIQAGVGFLILATLTGLAGLDLAKANAVKVFVVLIYTLAALGVFFWSDSVDIVKGLVLACGNMTGAYFGSRWASRVDPRYLRYVIAGMALILALELWFAP